GRRGSATLSASESHDFHAVLQIGVDNHPSPSAPEPVVSERERRPELVPVRRRLGATARRSRRGSVRARLGRARLGPAGLGGAGVRTVVADTQAPIGRRYFAFLGLAEQHPDAAWPLFERYLVTPGAHHAFVAAAVEAARYYSGRADVLVSLFERIRGDQLLRRFLGPTVLESL